MLFAYFGPDVLLPVTSVVACVAGTLMMFGRSILQLSVRGFRAIWRRKSEPGLTSAVRAGAGRHRRDAGEPVPSRPSHAGRHEVAVEMEG